MAVRKSGKVPGLGAISNVFDWAKEEAETGGNIQLSAFVTSGKDNTPVNGESVTFSRQIEGDHEDKVEPTDELGRAGCKFEDFPFGEFPVAARVATLEAPAKIQFGKEKSEPPADLLVEKSSAPDGKIEVMATALSTKGAGMAGKTIRFQSSVDPKAMAAETEITTSVGVATRQFPRQDEDYKVKVTDLWTAHVRFVTIPKKDDGQATVQSGSGQQPSQGSQTIG